MHKLFTQCVVSVHCTILQVSIGIKMQIGVDTYRKYGSRKGRVVVGAIRLHGV